jgi:hypothetical protein
MPQMPPLDGKQMDATISPAGAISIGSTGEMPKNYSPTQIAAASAAMSGPMVQQFINPLNTFAAAVAAAPSQKTGTSWHALSPEQIDVVYTITGRQAQSGHDTLAVKMASPSGNGPSISGQGNYDPSAHLVVTLHSEVRQSPGGPSSITDVALGS